MMFKKKKKYKKDINKFRLGGQAYFLLEKFNAQSNPSLKKQSQ
jgi:hypothetical protein